MNAKDKLKARGIHNTFIIVDRKSSIVEVGIEDAVNDSLRAVRQTRVREQMSRRTKKL